MESLTESFGRVRVVLVEPTYDGNLGKVARAMANFGLSKLWLVGGRADPRSEEARWYSRVEAEPILDAVTRTKTLEQAIEGCRDVIGSSRRLGKKRTACGTVSDVLADAAPWSAPWDTALVFGREAHGLSTEELDCCRKLMWIPTDPACPSMNLSQAVGLVGYVLAELARDDRGEERLEAGPPPASSEVLEAMYEHARRVWTRIGYLHVQNPDAILRRWRRILGRAELTEYDVRVVRALVHQTEWVAGIAGIPEGGPPDAPPGLFDKHAGQRARDAERAAADEDPPQ